MMTPNTRYRRIHLGLATAAWIAATATGLLSARVAGAHPPGPDLPSTILAGLANPLSREGDPTALHARVERLARLLAEAQFRAVIQRASSLRAALPSFPAAQVAVSAAQLEIAAATAHLALNEPGEASDCVSRALDWVPDLDLDTHAHPRKLLLTFERARRPDARTVHADRIALEASALQADDDRAPVWIEGPAVASPRASTVLHPTIPLRLLVDAEGRVRRARVYLPRPELAPFEKAALEAAKRFRFEPALHGGVPVAVWIQWSIHFE